MGFFETYFIDPIKFNTGYNVVNTAAYALILVALVFVVYVLLRRLHITIDKRFAIAIFPYIILGGVLRALEDLLEATGATNVLVDSFFSPFIIIAADGTARNMLFISPIMYISMFFLALIPLLIAKAIERITKVPYYKTWFIVGAVLVVAAATQLRVVNTFALVAMVGITAVWAGVLFGARFALKGYAFFKKLLTTENTSILLVHLFDATTTFVALAFFPYFEQHVVAGFFVTALGPAGIFVLKLVVVSLVLYFLDKELSKPEDFEKRTFIKIVIIILGLGPGLRNFLRLIMAV